VTGDEQSAKPNALVRGWRALVCADDRWQKERRTFPLFRWIIGIILLATTLPDSRAVGTWWHAHAAVIIFAAAIVFGPDLASLSLGGFKMDLLRETREDLREVRSAVVNLQSQKQAQGQSLNVILSGLDRLLERVGPENIAKLLSVGAEQAASEKDRGTDVPAADALSQFLQTTPDQDHLPSLGDVLRNAPGEDDDPGPVDQPDTGR
jgi:hypothetical protein